MKIEKLKHIAAVNLWIAAAVLGVASTWPSVSMSLVLMVGLALIGIGTMVYAVGLTFLGVATLVLYASAWVVTVGVLTGATWSEIVPALIITLLATLAGALDGMVVNKELDG